MTHGNSPIEATTATTLSDLLLGVSTQVNRLRDEAGQLLEAKEDTDGYREKRQEIGRLVASLPGMLAAFAETGGDVPHDVIAMAAYLSDEAERRLASRTGFGLGTLLVLDRNATYNDPDCLQVLAAKYQPPIVEV